MQLSIGGLIGLISTCLSLATALVVIGVYIGSFKSRFVTHKKFEEHQKLMFGKFDKLSNSIHEMNLSWIKGQLSAVIKGRDD